MSQTVKVPVSSLSEDRHAIFNRTLRSFLSTELAKLTIAQIIDGLPMHDNKYLHPLSTQMYRNQCPSPEAMEKAAHQLQEYFNTDVQIDAKLAKAYQVAILPSAKTSEEQQESQEFYMRLLEMLAVACHDFAADVYNRNQPGLRAQERDAELLDYPTYFIHEDYGFYLQYPKGKADMVGYWAESKLFGGVVLFDRGESGTECKSVYIHPVARFMIFQLSGAQMDQFGKYVKQLDGLVKSPFPLIAERYAKRVHPNESMGLNIYRDRNERIPGDGPARIKRASDMPDLEDGFTAFLKSVNIE